MLTKQPENLFLKKKQIIIYDLYYTLKRNELQYEESLDIILKNIALKKRINDSCGLSKSYRGLGVFWRIQKNREKSLPLLEKALIIAQKCNDIKEEARSILALAGYYFAIENYKKSLELNVIALKLSKQHNYVGGIANSNYQMARTHNLLKDFKKGLFHLKKAEQGFLETQNLSALERVNFAYAVYYRKKGESQKAITYYSKTIDYNLKLRDSSRLMNRFLGLSNSYGDSKDFEKAYYNYLNYKGLQKKINDKKQYGKLIELESRLKYENEKRIDSIKFAQQKALDEQKIKDKANTRFLFFVIGSSVLLIIVFILYILYRQKAKEQAYQNILLNKKVATKTEEIEELLKETMKHLSSKEKLTSDLQKYSKEEDVLLLQSIISDLKASKADDKKLSLIKQNIQNINFEFIRVLKETHPNLTKTEIEVCSFIKMGLSRKEISEIRGTSDFAVKTMRNRIRKKIEIESSITLDEYLKSLQ
jgi:transcriptional regulator